MADNKRSYHEFCGIAKALDVVGERWTLLILRDMLMGPRRYNDLLTGLPGITTNLLAKRLREMEASGLIEKVSSKGTSAYTLTENGRRLEPALMALGAWGSQFLTAPDAEDIANIGWGLISLKRRYRALEEPMTVQFNAGERTFQYRLTSAYADLRESSEWIPDLTLRAEIPIFQQILFRGASVEAMIEEGKLFVSGARLPDLLEAFGLKP